MNFILTLTVVKLLSLERDGSVIHPSPEPKYSPYSLPKNAVIHLGFNNANSFFIPVQIKAYCKLSTYTNSSRTLYKAVIFNVF